MAGESLHIYGEVGELTLNSGRTVVESGASVDAVDVVPTESEAKVEIRQNAEVQSVTSRPAQDATAIIVIDKDTVLPVLVAARARPSWTAAVPWKIRRAAAL